MALIISRRSFYCPNFATAPSRAGSLGAAGNLIFKEPVNPAGSIEEFFLALIILLHRGNTDIAHPLPMRTRVIAH